MSMTAIEKRPEDLIGQLNAVERKNAPAKLFLAGDAELLRHGRRVSVVGSRRASKAGLSRAASLTKALVSSGVTVVSGLAKGIDTAAHTNAISNGGRTIAVLGNPLGTYYPASNRRLQEEIAASHLAVTQFPAGYPSLPKNWPQRNRTMALLTDCTVIVEAGEGSGTLHQGWEALRLGRPLFLMESVTMDESLDWPAAMIGYGAQILSRSNLDSFLEEIPTRASSESLAV